MRTDNAQMKTKGNDERLATDLEPLIDADERRYGHGECLAGNKTLDG